MCVCVCVCVCVLVFLQSWWVVSTENLYYSDLWFTCNETCYSVAKSHTADAGNNLIQGSHTHNVNYLIITDVCVCVCVAVLLVLHQVPQGVLE